ncbi:diadenylate cyclase CdaA [Anaerolineales bacterium]
MEELLWTIQSITATDILDIFIVTMMFYFLSFLFRGTQAVALFRGMLILVITLIGLSTFFQLQALSWLLSAGITILAVSIPVVFQPELRRALEQLGRGGMFFNRQVEETKRDRIIIEICKACTELSQRRHGALIVLQRNSNLQEFISTGVLINSDVTSELLLTIFWPKTDLHDGAVIIDQDGDIASAASVLPLTSNRNLPSKKMGTRHRAALGISDVSDAICVVVSEETGRISITNSGRMITRLDPERLSSMLDAFYGEGTPDKSFRQQFKDIFSRFWSSQNDQSKESKGSHS